MSGFNPRRIVIVVGMVLTNLVTRRLIHGLIFFPSIPSMIAWPANVPVVDEDNPDDRRVIPKITAAGGTKRGRSALNAMSIGRTDIFGENAPAANILFGSVNKPSLGNIMLAPKHCKSEASILTTP